MDNNQNLTIAMAGSLLMGAGLTQISTSTQTGLILVGIGALLQIVVALLQKFGVPVQSNNQG
jgi:hypothetical protein